jgi:hypothetical protein
MWINIIDSQISSIHIPVLSTLLKYRPTIIDHFIKCSLTKPINAYGLRWNSAKISEWMRYRLLFCVCWFPISCANLHNVLHMQYSCIACVEHCVWRISEHCIACVEHCVCRISEHCIACVEHCVCRISEHCIACVEHCVNLHMRSETNIHKITIWFLCRFCESIFNLISVIAIEGGTTTLTCPLQGLSFQWNKMINYRWSILNNLYLIHSEIFAEFHLNPYAFIGFVRLHFFNLLCVPLKTIFICYCWLPVLHK